jgi:outer membrane putative beta-barrel porin/alpha-amylase
MMLAYAAGSSASPSSSLGAIVHIAAARNRFARTLCVVWFATIAAIAASVHGELFEFCDDFTKPYCAQRDPWEERIETERHDFTQSAVTVGRGVAQIESGYSYFYKDEHGEIESSHTFPEMLFRIGLSEDIEFRLRWDYVWQFIDEAPDQIGAEDLRYSLKFQLTRQCGAGWLPTSALELRSSAPTGGEAFTTEQAEFALDYIYEWKLTTGVTLAGSTGFGTNGFGDFGLLPEEPARDNSHALSQSAVLGFELTESNTMYAEWYGIYSDGLEDEFVISIFNIGIDHYITDNFVVDVRTGVGLSDDSDDFFAGVGGGYRF